MARKSKSSVSRLEISTPMGTIAGNGYLGVIGVVVIAAGLMALRAHIGH